MNCREAEQLLHAYIDKELDAANAFLLEQHFGTCNRCKQLLIKTQALQAQIQSAIPYYSAPTKLENTILEAIKISAVSKNKAPATARKFIGHGFPAFMSRNWKLPGLLLATSFAVVLSTSLLIQHSHQVEEQQLIQELFTGYMRAISNNRLTETSYKDMQELKGWLLSRLDFAPKILQMEEQGYQLKGARIDYLQQQKVVALTYLKNDHAINLYTWPSNEVEDSPQDIHYMQGYKLLYWCQKNMNYWLVSDTQETELNNFARLVQAELNK